MVHPNFLGHLVNLRKYFSLPGPISLIQTKDKLFPVCNSFSVPKTTKDLGSNGVGSHRLQKDPGITLVFTRF